MIKRNGEGSVEVKKVKMKKKKTFQKDWKKKS